MDYEVNYPIQLATVIDCAKTGLSTTAIDVLDIPQGFVATGIFYEEITKAGTSVAITLKAKTAHSVSGSFTGFTTGASAAAKAWGYVPAISLSASDGSSGTVTVPGTFATKTGDVLTVAAASSITSGRIRIGLVGFLTGATAVVASAGDNKASADPYTPPESR